MMRRAANAARISSAPGSIRYQPRRAHGHHAARGQPHQRLAHQRAADAEQRGQFLLAQARARRQLLREHGLGDALGNVGGGFVLDIAHGHHYCKWYAERLYRKTCEQNWGARGSGQRPPTPNAAPSGCMAGRAWCTRPGGSGKGRVDGRMAAGAYALSLRSAGASRNWPVQMSATVRPGFIPKARRPSRR